MVQLIANLLWLWILGIIAGGSYVVWALYVRGDQRKPATVAPSRPGTAAQGVTTRKTVAPAPVAQPRSASGPVAQSPARPTTQGGGEYQRRGVAPTVKLAQVDAAKPAEAAKPAVPAPKPAAGNDDQAMAELFSGVEKKDDQGPVDPNSLNKASRIEELGFHVGGKAEGGSGSQPAVAKDAPKPAVPENRSQTAELDDILKRIDAVLADGGAPAAEATLTEPQKQQGGHETLPVSQPSPKETDGGQQKLF